MKPIPYGYHCIDKKDMRAVLTVLKSPLITQGPLIRKFEDALARYCQAKYAVCVSSGTAGLHLACLSAGIGEGEEVITSPITFAASANCILYCGARPVFADIHYDTGNIDAAQIKNKLSRKTRAVIPVHFAGHPCDLEAIHNIAKRRKIIVIEDATHALGAEYKGVKIGSCRYSDMAVFSFHPVKSITAGEGGAVLTNRKDLYELMLMLRNHGITKEKSKLQFAGRKFTAPWYYEQQVLGFNYRITDFQCALGLSQLKKLDSFIRRRRRIASEYNRFFSGREGVSIPQEEVSARSAYHLYVIRLESAELRKHKSAIFKSLVSKKIYPQVHYIPVYWQPYYRDLGYDPGLCPNAEKFYESEISLPIFPRMSAREIGYVKKMFLETVHKFL